MLAAAVRLPTRRASCTQLLARGSDFEGLQERHAAHTGAMRDVEGFFTARPDVSVRVVDREGYSEEAVRWCDAVLTAGGDGTFLYGAGRLSGASKPIVGINTDPARYASASHELVGVARHGFSLSRVADQRVCCVYIPTPCPGNAAPPTY